MNTEARPARRLAVVTAITGTVFIAAGAFWLSFTSLADLAHRSGISNSQAWAWPLIVDGIIVVATVAVVALAGQRRPTWYPWTLLAAGAIVSVTANAIHAVIAADADVPSFLAASVAAVPPLVLLAITHLTVILTRPIPLTAVEGTGLAPVDAPGPEHTEQDQESPALPVETSPSGNGMEPSSVLADLVEMASVHERRAVASQLRYSEGWSNKQIARHLGVHPSTVGRWFTPVTTSSTDPLERTL
ncbi:DUF2637 domain-containing protein [Leucobacter chromiireducens]|uniref:DUF2637 domain-containing protein n=1 Tax=Leucobacter chromiireducens subsp. chromiireducens TaxID=660067 RepID=A0ABS1SRB9_9MICO|nr:DUF2637 domain-containing protein [Leucobacter chromiireducens]MBL3690490.1 DUF2637 domain-containing protein [Leucobacter chromiireducens subsp. chromiireducens]